MRLVDRPLAAELGVYRNHRQAVGLHATVSAPFTDRCVDEHPPGRIGELATLAPAAFLGGAGLVIDQDRHAGMIAQFALHGIELIAMMNRRIRGEVRDLSIFFRIVGDNDDPLDAFRRQLTTQLCDAQLPSTCCPPVIATASL
jgi:hypothetical protein